MLSDVGLVCGGLCVVIIPLGEGSISILIKGDINIIDIRSINGHNLTNHLFCINYTLNNSIFPPNKSLVQLTYRKMPKNAPRMLLPFILYSKSIGRPPAKLPPQKEVLVPGIGHIFWTKFGHFQLKNDRYPYNWGVTNEAIT